MKNNEYNFQLLVTNVQALTKEQEALNIHIPSSGKSYPLFIMAKSIKDDPKYQYLIAFRGEFKKQIGNTNYNRISLETFKSQYRQLLSISELIQQTPDEATKTKIQLILTGSIITYEQTSNDLFQTLIIESSLNESSEYIDLVTSSIKVLKIIQHLNKLRTKNDITEYFNDSKVILPSEIFPIARENKELTQGDSDNSYENQLKSEAKILSDINRLLVLRDEVGHCYEIKLNEARSREQTLEEFCVEYYQNQREQDEEGESTPQPIPTCGTAYELYKRNNNLEYIDAKCITNETSLQIFNDLGFRNSSRINVKFILKAIDNKISQLSSRLENRALSNRIVRIGNSVISVNQDAFEKQICTNEPRKSHCDLLKEMRAKIPTDPLVRVLGVGHHQVIRDQHKQYVSTSLAHNEPILQGEVKESVYRNKKVTEIYSETETEREEENSTDTKTKDSFELGKEIAKESSQNQKFDAGIKVTASYPQVRVEASANYATQNASQEKTKSSVKQAKETISRSINKVKEKVREFRSSKTIN
jgi:hypothetical protein